MVEFPLIRFVKDENVFARLENASFSPGRLGAILPGVEPGVSIEFDQQSNPTVDIFFGDIEFVGTSGSLQRW